MPTATDPLANAVAVGDLVGYQSGSIVSRILLKTAAGSVTIFAFDEGQELSEHTAPFDALVTVVEGRVEVRVSGEPHVLSDGHAILLPANDPHALKALTPFKMVLTMLRG